MVLVRGVKKSDARMESSAMLGVFSTGDCLSQDFYSKLQMHSFPAGEVGDSGLF